MLNSVYHSGYAQLSAGLDVLAGFPHLDVLLVLWDNQHVLRRLQDGSLTEGAEIHRNSPHHTLTQNAVKFPTGRNEKALKRPGVVLPSITNVLLHSCETGSLSGDA